MKIVSILLTWEKSYEEISLMKYEREKKNIKINRTSVS